MPCSKRPPKFTNKPTAIATGVIGTVDKIQTREASRIFLRTEILVIRATASRGLRGAVDPMTSPSRG